MILNQTKDGFRVLLDEFFQDDPVILKFKSSVAFVTGGFRQYTDYLKTLIKFGGLFFWEALSVE